MQTPLSFSQSTRCPTCGRSRVAAVRPATESDLPVLKSLYEQARHIMRASGNLHQWTGGYPDVATVLADIRGGYSQLCLDDGGQPVATFAFLPGPEPTYARLYDGTWLDDTLPYGVLHRLAKYPEAGGVAETCLRWCYARIPNLRADTHRDNHIMRHLLQSHGFHYCGIIHLANGDERLAYQALHLV